MTSEKINRSDMLEQLKGIVLQTLKDCDVNVYLFGSWAREEEKRTSDIDIAIQGENNLPAEKWVTLTERIEESTLPYRVDLVDLSKTNSVFRGKAIKEGIVWKDCEKK